MSLLKFSVYQDDYAPHEHRDVYVDPASIVSIESATRRPPYGFNQAVVVIITTHGKHVVYGNVVDVARRIEEARASAPTPKGAETP